MSYDDHRNQSDWADFAFRRRALKVNSGIYARRHGPDLLPVLPDRTALRARYVSEVGWLASEATWGEEDARRVGKLACEITRFGKDHGPETAADCNWHAARLRELMSQYSVLHKLEVGLPSTLLGRNGMRRSSSQRRMSGSATARL